MVRRGWKMILLSIIQLAKYDQISLFVCVYVFVVCIYINVIMALYRPSLNVIILKYMYNSISNLIS